MAKTQMASRKMLCNCSGNGRVNIKHFIITLNNFIPKLKNNKLCVEL